MNVRTMKMWICFASAMAGSHGFCGGRGSESSLDLLVHSEIRQRESSASVLWTYFSMTLHGAPTEKRRRKRDSQGINSVLQHALVSQVDTQQRTFQGLLNMTLSDSRDNWSRSKHIDELNVGSTGQLCPERGDKHSREMGRESAYHDM